MYSYQERSKYCKSINNKICSFDSKRRSVRLCAAWPVALFSFRFILSWVRLYIPWFAYGAEPPQEWLKRTMREKQTLKHPDWSYFTKESYTEVAKARNGLQRCCNCTTVGCRLSRLSDESGHRWDREKGYPRYPKSYSSGGPALRMTCALPKKGNHELRLLYL